MGHIILQVKKRRGGKRVLGELISIYTPKGKHQKPAEKKKGGFLKEKGRPEERDRK